MRILLRAVLVLIGIGALAFLIWEPQAEGVNAHKALFEIYFKDPFVWYAYIGSVPFFVALVQAFKAVGHPSAKAFRTIKRCMLIVIGFVAGGEIIIMMNTSDDRAGGVFMGLLVGGVSAIVAAVAARLEKKF